ncbi:hypothetical protein BD413DRAFT_607270 [Trametes elegans]|nr:hypothetical protein BD413DRAFT_607270 [Trametes elegans]
MSDNASETTRLKAEGNALFVKKDFTGGYNKYTEAVKLDEKNAILYSNRAACSLGLGSYPRAWARKATASAGLGKRQETVDNWEHAVAVLPVDNLNPAEQKQWGQYTAELTAAKAKAAGAIELSNAVLSDARGVVIEEQDSFEKYNKQVVFEVTRTQAWVSGNSRTVMEAAPKRLAEQGWDSVRTALSCTVRGWIMRAFSQGQLTNDVEAALDFYTTAIEVFQWGLEKWMDVPTESKGAIFQDSFLRGVKCLRLDAYLKPYKEKPEKFPPEEILAGAQDLIDELVYAPEESPGAGHFLSFVRYPLAQAHGLRGFYYWFKAHSLRAAGAPEAEMHDTFGESIEAYIKASTFYPGWLEVGCPAHEALQLLDAIHDKIPIAKRIWEFSADAVSGRDEPLKDDMMRRDHIRGALAAGEYGPNGALFKDNAVPSALRATSNQCVAGCSSCICLFPGDVILVLPNAQVPLF